MTVTGSTISGNSVGGGFSGGGIGGGITNAGALSITNTTISGNSAGGATGHLMGSSAASGGGIYDSGRLTITDATIAGNSVGDSFAWSIRGVYPIPGTGGGIFGGPMTLTNTLIANNTNGTSKSDIQGSVVSTSSCNLIGDGTGLSGIADGVDGNRIGTASKPIDALLGPLADNGGPTATMALLPGSPAIDAGVSVAGVTADQRGIPRPQGPAADIGAFESRGFTVTIVSGDNQSTPPLSPFATALTVTVESPFGEPVAGGRVSFTPPMTGASADLAGNPAMIDTSGRAVVQASANSLVGAYTVSAGVPGAHGVAFTLTNVPPPTLVGLRSFVNPNHPTTLVLTFSVPMDAAGAQDTSNYRLVWAGKDHQLGTGDDQVIPLQSARYDAASWSVKLRLLHRQPLNRTLWLTMNATSPDGLTNAFGMPLWGAGTAGPGSEQPVPLDLKALRRPMRLGLLLDGGFEAPKIKPAKKARTLSAGNPALAPWHVSSGSVNVQTYWPEPEGTRTLDLNGVSAGTIEQSFATIPGQLYQLLFDYANNPDAPARTAAATVTVTGAGTLLSLMIAHAGSSPRNMKYTRFLRTFVADSATTTLRIASTTPGTYGIVLDAVSVMALPGAADTTPG
jgi:choice-of-anchor C domain-containing protein